LAERHLEAQLDKNGVLPPGPGLTRCPKDWEGRVTGEDLSEGTRIHCFISTC